MVSQKNKVGKLKKGAVIPIAKLSAHIFNHSERLNV